ncbi:asparaginase [Pseudomonas oleovorans]|uniref:Asparaginase n=1 Tax=Ectopseudomonas oleovorans TaxID=301 RepID=A0AB35L132_ECTOL|nr:asparaginase [Pseudomonas oleovorans]MCR1827978.1 asparaginase [Pseudomonas oleovorans]MDH0567805.1 asparaginase [Pseudomonas oleovorans]
MATPEKLLVLYTGGTIGMQMSADGLAPASGFEARMRTQQASENASELPQWSFRELLPLIDSANMNTGHWLALRDEIVTAVQTHGHDAVLVLHGTDTLAYSAAALSFLLLGLDVPVVLTGAMQPAGVDGGDAWPNLFGAMRALHRGVAPGVHLYFNGQLLHGARCSKLRSDAFDAFQVLPRQRQAERAEVAARIDYRQARKAVNLAVLPLHPAMQAGHLHALLASGVQGLLLECYGSGTGPAGDAQLMSVLREAHQRGVVLAAISQCPQGHVQFGVYAAGSRLAEVGLVSCGGMTREAALGKLFALLGAGLPQTEVEYWLARDLCGEMSD